MEKSLCLAVAFTSLALDAIQPVWMYAPAPLMKAMTCKELGGPPPVLDLAKQFGVSIKVSTGPHERLAGLHDESVFAMSPFLQFADEINANQ